MKDTLENIFEELNVELDNFWANIGKQNNYDKAVLVANYEFGRTLIPNSKYGRNHFWGGNYFIMGGQVKGGQVLGKYTDDLNGPFITKCGRVIPITPWDTVLYVISQCMGVTDEYKLHKIILNRETEIENGEIFHEADFFKDSDLTGIVRRSLHQKK